MELWIVCFHFSVQPRHFVTSSPMSTKLARFANVNSTNLASSGREELLKQLAKLRAEIEPLQYAQAIGQRLDRLRDLHRMAAEAAFWNSKLPGFTQLLRKITDAAKHAYEQLVVADFEARLDA